MVVWTRKLKLNYIYLIGRQADNDIVINVKPKDSYRM